MDLFNVVKEGQINEESAEEPVTEAKGNKNAPDTIVDQGVPESEVTSVTGFLEVVAKPLIGRTEGDSPFAM